MKERGKSEDTAEYNNNNLYSSSSGLQCRKHPSSSPVGICAYCLKDRLMKLVCSDCGEQRLSSCSCSDVSSYRNSSCTVDIGSVGRISFLIENDEQRKTEDVVVLKRSNSCVVEVKKSNGFWRIGKLFKRRREKEGFRDRDCAMDVSRSRSMCSYRGGGNLNFNFNFSLNSDEEMGCYSSSAKISDFNESEPRKSGFRGGFMDFESGFSAKESEFSRIHDDSSFIDLKLDLSDRSNPPELGGSSSCRITVNDRGIKKGNKGHSKVWKWIFKQHSGKKDLNHILEA